MGQGGAEPVLGDERHLRVRRGPGEGRGQLVARAVGESADGLELKLVAGAQGRVVRIHVDGDQGHGAGTRRDGGGPTDVVFGCGDGGRSLAGHRDDALGTHGGGGGA